MVRIRLRRIGRKKSPVYQIVAIDSRRARGGSYIERLGNYEPLGGTWSIDREGIMSWIKKGASPSDVVSSLLKRSGDSGTDFASPSSFKEKKRKKAIEAAAAKAAEAEVKADAEKAPEAPAAETPVAEAPVEADENSKPKVEENKKENNTE